MKAAKNRTLNQALVFSKCSFKEAPEKNIFIFYTSGILWLRSNILKL
jgi:hypothetical protein